MQLFVLASCPVLCAKLHCDTHVVSQLKELVQILYTALKYMGFAVTASVTLPDGTDAPPYAPVWPHPCCHWVAASITNIDWTVQLGAALSAEYTTRYGKVHRCQHHLYHIKSHVDSIRDQLPAGFTDPADWHASLSDKARESVTPRTVTHEVPIGTSFAVLAMEPDMYARNSDGNVSAVDSYRKFYAYKAKHKFAMYWHKSTTVPTELQSVWDSNWSSVAPLVRVPKRKRDEPTVVSA